ncbi:MAG TPA: YkgJ family cysteine cluster protein [Geopsychrobacteraceae bacterium]|jgi:Fe-S-cluster containining protein
MSLPQRFNCTLCGHCCLHLVDAYQGCVSDADLQRWQAAGREDLLAWVETLDLGHDNLLHMVWVHPETGDNVERCPWLLDMLGGQGHLCGIDAVKPDYCRAYPEHRRHAQDTGCSGYLSKRKG